MPVLGCEVGQNTCEVGVFSDLFDGFQPGQKAARFLGRDVAEPVLIALAKPARQHCQVFHFHQLVQVRPQPGVAPPDGLAQLPPIEGGGAAGAGPAPAFGPLALLSAT